MRPILITILILAVIGLVLYATSNNQVQDRAGEMVNKNPDRASSQTASNPVSEMPNTPFTASFTIYTNGTARIFTDPKYHHRSTDVYLEPEDHNTIHIKLSGTTWSEFFQTLPMSLSKDCLTTGTGQNFCTNGSKTLRFYINNTEDLDALDRDIAPNDSLRIDYE